MTVEVFINKWHSAIKMKILCASKAAACAGYSICDSQVWAFK